MVCFYIIKLKIKLWEKERKMRTQVKVSAVKIGMVKIVAFVMLMIGMNVQANYIDNSDKHLTKSDMINNNFSWLIPVEVVGINAFRASLEFDFSKADSYTPPTIRLKIPISPTEYRWVEITQHYVTMNDINILANRLGIKLDFCSDETEMFETNEKTLYIHSNKAMCNITEVDVEKIYNKLSIMLVDK